MDNPSPDKNEKRSARRWPLTIGVFVALGLVAGAAIGAARIYGSGGASVHAGQAANAHCTATATYQTAIDPLLAGDMAAMAIRDEPENLSALAFNDNAGTPITLADTGKKLRLINLWATWCAPCREEMPWLETLQQERGGEGFEVVAISVDGGSDDKPRAFLDEIGVDGLAFYHDPTIGVFNALKRDGLAFGLPVTLLVDEAGCVIANMNGPAHWSSPDAFALIDGALAARPGS
ncbi:thiol:disulfide interchange protein TlpA [Oceaniradius stylonematis]|uniref:thiol:disulfide interchange protein TlpA n=1 Tax=Oceaniradius stylonematis TaxID=2184161 RepID=UPI003C7AB8A1